MTNQDDKTQGGSQQQQQQQQEEQQDEHVAAEIAAGTAFPRIPLPIMVDGSIDAYFMSLDFWFLASGVQNDTRRFNTVMAQVPPAKLLELRSIIDACPDRNKYNYIKQKLIEHFADSQQRRLQRVLSDMPLGDKKPSQLYYDMSRTANGALSDAVLLDLWAARLPTHAQAAVVASQGAVSERVRIADAITESMSMRSINSFESSSSSSSSLPTADAQWPGMDVLRSEISAMFRSFEAGLRQTGRSHSRVRDVSRNRSQSRGREDSDLCWYHRRFGNKATTCRRPCKFSRTDSQ